jgi:DNA polymerase-1
MERVGIKLDQVKLWELNQIVTIKIQEIERQVFEIAQLDQNFNLNSPRQVEELLFQRLGLPTQKKSSKRTGYSTDQEVLDALSDLHPVPKLILKYRELTKLKTTYLEALPGYLNPDDGCVHTSFSQIATATGRLASSDPNLQNIPVSGIGGQVRAAFLPQEGQVFLAADYSQIELRVLAYLSQDQVLVNSFQNNLDIHSLTASRLFDVDQSLVSHEQRQIGKRINFSILYGLTPYGLSKDLKISLGSAKKYIERFFEQYPGVQSWMDSVVAQAKECGYVTTVWGRRRYVPGIYEKNQNLYDAAKRIAINTVAQGTAAELVKKGMLDLEQRLAPFDAQILLQIHDELLVSVAQDQAGPAQEVLVQVLENVVSWNVPLQVTIRSGQNWQEVTK